MFEEDYERLRGQSEKDTENFLKQLEITREVYSDFSKARLCQEKQTVSKGTLESLLMLQFYTSKAIIEVCKTFNGCLVDLHSQLKQILNDI